MITILMILNRKKFKCLPKEVIEELRAENESILQKLTNGDINATRILGDFEES